MTSKGKQLATWGVILQFGWVVGLVGTIIGMVRAFGKPAESEAAQVSALANDINIALLTTAVGWVLALVGVVLIFIALLGIRYRASWFYTALWILSVLWLFSFPLGTILGIVGIVYIVKHKKEFLEPTSAPYSGSAPGASSERMT